ncbi:hypothetical protein EYF80_009483 [Liparis tanakae]|uniref:Uncharacterized protein n=1 Tax=Liparis tanakae TaxID=230148 RepID=A0A4Z2IRC2_9TELE|nr:hypothetical protein EYF80_009483 [Liparis tanakae]
MERQADRRAEWNGVTWKEFRLLNEFGPERSDFKLVSLSTNQARMKWFVSCVQQHRSASH